MRIVLCLALFGAGMYLVYTVVNWGSSRWGLIFPAGVLALEYMLARWLDYCR